MQGGSSASRIAKIHMSVHAILAYWWPRGRLRRNGDPAASGKPRMEPARRGGTVPAEETDRVRGLRTAVITGISGQDGAYLAKLLLDRGYSVVGTSRSPTRSSLWRLAELQIFDAPRLQVVPQPGVSEADQVRALLAETRPDEVYNLAGQSHVAASFADPIGTARANALAPLHLLEAIRDVAPHVRFFQAGSAEIFGAAAGQRQDERTPVRPVSPYGASKAFAQQIAEIYREAHGLFAAVAIMFNHESPLRGEQFVTRKNTSGAARIRAGRLEFLELGNLNAVRDWGFAGDYVEAMVRMTTAECPATYVLATGRSHTVRDFVRLSFAAVGFDLVFEGSGLSEVGVDRASGRPVVRIAERFYRPADSNLIGSAAGIKAALGWEPSMALERICQLMVEADLRRESRGN